MFYGDDRLPERFWDKVIPDPNTGCWLWVGAIGKGGYGNFYFQGRHVNAHRVVFDVVHDDHTAIADHLCEVKSCVNPDHLVATDIRGNTSRALGYATAKTCRSGHVLSEVGTWHSVREDGSVKILCAQCGKERNARARVRR